MTLRSHIRFEEPPAKLNRKAGKTKHEKVAEKLTKRVGEWAFIGTYTTAGTSNSIAYMIRKGKAPAYAPAGSFEAVSRLVDNEYRIYARYVGPDGDRL